MSLENYAFIKDNIVVNVVVFDDPDEATLDYFKELHKVDSVILSTEKTAVGGEYDGERFWSVKPYPSWIKGVTDWEAPVEYPQDGKVYFWDEESLSWVEVI